MINLTDKQIENCSTIELTNLCNEIMRQEKNIRNFGYQKPREYSTKIKDAFELVNFVQKNKFWCQLKTPFDPSPPSFHLNYICGFTPHGVTGWNGRPDHCASGSTLEIAICKAFLRWQRDYKEGNLTERKYYEETE